MPHVHLFRDVRRRVVDDDALFRGRERHAEALVARYFFERAFEECGLEREVDEPGAGDLDAVGNVREVDSRDDGFGDLAWRTLQRFREAHRQVGLEVGALGPADHRVDGRVLGAEGFADGALQARREDRSRIVRGRHGELPGRFERSTLISGKGPTGSRPRSIRCLTSSKDRSMEPSPVIDLKAFVPARDYALAKQFYLDLGFAVNFSSDEIAELQIGSFRFLLQPFYVKDHSENFMMSLNVEDADAWWRHIERIGLKEKYPTIMARAPVMQPWGLRVLYLSDPTGVLWHITERRSG